MKAWTRRRLLASVKMGLAAIPFAVAIRVAMGGFIPGALVLGFGAGFSVGIAELFVFRRWLRGLPFVLHIAIKAVALVLVMWLAFAMLNLLDVAAGSITWSGYAAALIAADTLLGLAQYLGVIGFLLFFVQLDRLLGPGVLLGYVSGRYHHPRREDRIFMFLDLQGSTTLADRMEADRYFEFLHRYFTEMSEPILETDAQIYQYVGDEVVLTWKKRSGLEEANCIRVFFLIAEHLHTNRDRFLRDFGAVPAFKAGVHAGEVITAQIGELKKEIVYNGDVLNTTARIQAMCNPLGKSLLVSAELFDSLDLGPGYEAEPLGPQTLRGKTEPVELYAIRAEQAAG
jgi:adenylate cyclase